jgi:Ser/Thr protein kinase RdoA (MazF antagonist)
MKPTKSRATIREINRSRAMVHEIIAHHFGTARARTRYLPAGKTNFVFEVRHSAGRFVVRLNSDPTKIQGFMKEQWATSQVKKLGVPTPEIVEVSNEIVELPYMISRSVEGTEASFHPRRLEIVCELGRYAALIHSIRTRGFGSTFDWSKNKLSRNATWHEFLRDELKLTERLKLLKSLRLISDSTGKKLRTILKQARNTPQKAVLNHGDMRLKNVLVDKQGKIAAIVDWEHCVSNIVAWDFSIALHDLSIDEKQQFLAGYGVSDSFFTRLAPVIKALNIVNYEPAVQHLSKRERALKLKQYRLRLKGYLDLYSI